MDLKVQADGAGGLEELKEEFMDGRSVRCSTLLSSSLAFNVSTQRDKLTGLLVLRRIQYALIRITDGNSELPKFVQIVSSSLHFPPLSRPFLSRYKRALTHPDTRRR